MGYRDQAKNELEALVKLQPDDKVSAAILKVLNGTDESGNVLEQAPQPAVADAGNTAQPMAVEADQKPEEAAVKAPPVEMLSGKFIAKPSATDTITLELGPDQNFSWSVTSGSQSPRGFTGKFEYQDGVLALLSDQNGQRLVGNLVLESDGTFRFKVVDGPAEDPGLLFSKNS